VEGIATVDPSPATRGPAPVTPVELALPRGKHLTVRAMAEADAQGIWLLYEDLSREDRYRRFFAQSHPSHDFAEHWVHTCRTNGAGLVAVAAAGRVVGEAGYVLLPNGDGELALTVADDWRGWLGPYLVHLLVDTAAARGVRNLEADVLVDNRRMLAVLHHRPHATLGDGDFNVERVVIGASHRHPGWPPVRTGPQVLVEGLGARGPTAQALRRAGFDVMGCAGPAAQGVSCPVWRGEPCPLADGADAIVVAVPAEAGAARLLASHRRLAPCTPLVVEVADPTAAAGPDPGPQGRRLPVGVTSARLVETLELLLDRARSPSDGAGPRGTFAPRAPGSVGATRGT
jgi:RimJ/RimL family protein N-acetyltransferase